MSNATAIACNIQLVMENDGKKAYKIMDWFGGAKHRVVFVPAMVPRSNALLTSFTLISSS